MPQYLWRETHQSRAWETQSLNRAEPAHSGYQLTFAISESISSFRSEILINHWRVARYIIGVLQRQQCPYLWVICFFLRSAPRLSRSEITVSSASFTNTPSYGPSVYFPSPPTGQYAGSPFSIPTIKSSRPCPGAMCTIPVFSIVT